MHCRNSILISVVTVLLVLASSIPFVNTSGGSGSGSGGLVLFDNGNGNIEWADMSASPETTYGGISREAANSLGMIFNDSTPISINGLTSKTVFGSSYDFHSWKQYVWNGSAWIDNIKSLTEMDVSSVDYIMLLFYRSYDGSQLSPVSVPTALSSPPPSYADTVNFYIFDDTKGTGGWISGSVAANSTKMVSKALINASDDAGYGLSTYTDVTGMMQIRSIDGKKDSTSWTRYLPDSERSDGYGTSEYYSSTNNFASRDILSEWRFFIWERTSSEWTEVTYNGGSTYNGETLAWGFYPQGTVPSATPGNMYPWTMHRGDSSSSGSTTSVPSGEKAAEIIWHKEYGNGNYVCGTLLCSDDKLYVLAGGGYTESQADPALYCYDRITGEEKWKFAYPKGTGSEVLSPLIVGDNIFLPASNGSIYKIETETGKVSAFVWVPIIFEPISGQRSTGPASMVYDSGVIYFGASNGMIYCCNTDLELLWQYHTDSWIYYSTPTIIKGTLFMGAYDGCMYALDQTDGSLQVKETVYSRSGKGLANSLVAVDDTFIIPYSDGQGMNTRVGGVAGYRFDYDSSTLQYGFIKLWDKMDFGTVSNYALPLDKHVVISGGKGLFKIDVKNGSWVLLNEDLGTLKAPLTLLNGDTILALQYDARGSILELDLDGNMKGKIQLVPNSSSSYSMTPVLIINGMIYAGNDMGAVYAISGTLGIPADPHGDQNRFPFWVLAIVMVIILSAIVYYLVRTGRVALPFGRKETESHTKRNKRRLKYVILFGLIAVFAFFILSLAMGPSATLSLGDTLDALISSLRKGGKGLDFNELIVYESRLPRVMAVFAVGVGLATAGAMYQAIIRNPLVDPYIMGVSAGAGAAAVAMIVFNASLFGMSSVTSLYVTPLAAIIGGLGAFFATMFIAEKAGKSSMNYVLAGVVVGLAFSAVQTLLLSMAGDKLHDSMVWLFGSFANVSWNNVWLIFIPALCLSMIPLLWAKEFNLVLLGEDQAKQMGLNVVRFNRLMLILASVLTSVCVAFVGIIGFVGLVVPHVCRMIFGGDHRLVLPASIILGGLLMMAADLLAKMLMIPQELPVGAITTIIGVPVFAYLLIKRGRMYNG